jgi:hypothetical protein
LQVELAACKHREELLRTGLERSKKAVEDNALRREKCIRQKSEIVMLRGQAADARREVGLYKVVNPVDP